MSQFWFNFERCVPLQELLDDPDLQIFDPVNIPLACFDERPSVITLVQPHAEFLSNFNASVSTMSTGCATVANIPDCYLGCRVYLNILNLHPAIFTPSDVILPKLSQALSDVVCFLADDLPCAVKSLLLWAHHAESVRWRHINLRPIAYVVVRSKLQINTSNIESRFFSTLFTIDSPRSKWTKKSLLRSLFSDIRVIQVDSSKIQLPNEILESVLQSRADRGSLWRLWSIETFSKLQLGFFKQLKSPERTDLDPCSLLLSKSRLRDAEVYLWPHFFSTVKEIYQRISVKVFGEALAWEIAKATHVFHPQEVIASVLDGPYQRLLEAKPDWTYNFKQFNTVFEQRVDYFMYSAKSPNEEHLRALKSRRRFWLSMPSSKTCLSCLLDSSSLIFPCSHGICIGCWRLLSRDHGSNPKSFTNANVETYFLDCPFCGTEADLKVTLPPITGGSRVLCLDGGGVRGIITLQVIQEIEKKLYQITSLKLPIQAYFDLFVGSSVGGLIALGLGKEQWSVSDAIKRFRMFAGTIFPQNNTGSFLGGSWARFLRAGAKLLVYKSLYQSDSIIKTFRSVFGDSLLVGQGTPLQTTNYLRVAITALENSCGILTSYNKSGDRIHARSGSEWFQATLRPIKTFEAAACTSAAPAYLPAMQIDERCFSDGACVLHACPLSIALEEATSSALTIISIGCGMFEEGPKSVRANRSLIFRLLRHFNVHKTHQTDQFTLYNSFISRHNNSIVRINPNLSMEEIRLDEADKIQLLESKCGEALKSPQQKCHIRDAAVRLIANLFYFEFKSRPKRTLEGYDCRGVIYCSIRPCLQGKLMQRLSQARFKIGNYSFRPKITCQVRFCLVDLSDFVEISIDFCKEGLRAPICGFPNSAENVLEQQSEYHRGRISLAKKRLSSLRQDNTRRKRTWIGASES